MNSTFDLKRFWKYFLYDLSGIWKNNGMLLLVFSLVPAIFYLLYLFFGTLFSGELDLLFLGEFEISGPALLVRLPMAIVSATIFALLFPSRSYGHLTEKGRGSSWLMLPASRLEKYTSMMLNCLVLVPMAVSIGTVLVDSLVCLVDRSCGMSILHVILSDQSSWNTEKEIIICGNGVWLFLVQIISTAATFTLGALLFKKWKVLGTIFWLWVIEMVFAALFGFALNMYDIEELIESLGDKLAPQLPYFDIWLNALINISTAVVVAICGVWSWVRLKKLQH